MSRFAWCIHELVRLVAIAGWISLVVAAAYVIAPGRMP
jgi:hypothetical protein